MERFGKYLLMQQIAEGGMGEVFLARQRGLADVERMVVLKRIRPSLREEEKFENLFLSEARITARLNHPNVVQLYEFGRIDESYFLTFEQVRGFDVQALRKRRPEPWPLDVTIELLTQALSGLQHVHVLSDFDGKPLGIVHRDVSPPNIMVSMDGTAKLLDFGVARSSAAPRDPDRMVHGKFPYLSPEQCNFEALDGRSDLFSLGAVLYELLTGQIAFARPTRQETMAAILMRNPPPPSKARPEGLPPVVDELCKRALEKDRKLRYKDAESMQAELERIAQTLGLARGPRVLQRFLENVSADRPSQEVQRQPSVVTETVVRNLLLVDDDEENLQALRRTFRSAYNLFFTTDPIEALKIVEDNVVHVIVTDQRMPGLTGVELLQKASALRPGVLKVITSALSDTATLLSAINTAGIHRYLVKPWQPEELRRIVDDLVAEKAGALPVEAMRERSTSDELDEGGTTTLRGRPKPPSNSGPIPTSPTHADRTVVEEQQKGRDKQRLRPAIIAAFESNGFVALGMIAIVRSLDAGAEAVRQLESIVHAADAVIAISDDKLAVVLAAPSMPEVRAKAEALRMQLDARRVDGALENAILVLTYMPDDAKDPDEALMRASTALVLAKKRGGV